MVGDAIDAVDIFEFFDGFLRSLDGDFAVDRDGEDAGGLEDGGLFWAFGDGGCGGWDCRVCLCLD